MNKTHLPLVLVALLSLMGFTQTAFSALLLPLDVNDVYVYNKRDSATLPTQWTTTITGIGTVDIGGQQYVQALSWNSHGDGLDDGIIEFRSTDTAVYTPDGSVIWQIAPIGTIWSNPSYWEGLGSGMQVNEIIAIESVTVPSGTFDTAYVHQAYFVPDNSALDNTLTWEDYIVPGVGFVKQRDYTWLTNGPTIVELVQITSVPIPAAVWLFGSGLIGLIGVARRKKA